MAVAAFGATMALMGAPVFAAGVPDFQKAGFPEVVVHKLIDKGEAATLSYHGLKVEIPAGAFRTTVNFELLEGNLSSFSMMVPKGQKGLVDFAFQVVNEKTHALIGKFLKPVVIAYTNESISSKSEYWDVTDMGKLERNPVEPVIKGHTLWHANAGAPVGWLITTPDASTMMGKSGSSSGMIPASGVRAVVSNGKFAPSILHISKGDSVTFVFDGMGTDHFIIKGVTESPLVKVGETWTYKFNKAGTYHVDMADMGYIAMTVVVK